MDKEQKKALLSQALSPEVTAFLKKIEAHHLREVKETAGRGRLIFSLDATMSRQPSWDLACGVQADLFAQADVVGKLEVQLVYFRGIGECRASRWFQEAAPLIRAMTGLMCRGGPTQMGRVLTHLLREARQKPIQAFVYVGDCLEESADALCEKAAQAALLGVRFFLFQEGNDPQAQNVFQEMARMTKGAFFPFNAEAPDQLRSLLMALAAYVASGHTALQRLANAKNAEGQKGAQLLLACLPPPREQKGDPFVAPEKP